jgi:hypothetical protein
VCGFPAWRTPANRRSAQRREASRPRLDIPDQEICAGSTPSLPQAPGFNGCCHWTWWINRPALSRSTSGRFFVVRQSRQAFSSQSEAPSELFCGYLHPSARDMIQPPIWLVSLSSGNLWQGAREHLACRPSSNGPPCGHRRRTLSVALRQTLAPSLVRLYERYSQ